MAISTRRQLLRTRTASLHAALDACVGELDGLAGYRRYLVGLYAFRQPAEDVIASGLASATFADAWQPTRLAGLMREDMADLGLAPPPAVALGSYSALSAVLGLTYVLEGSALGARMLRLQVEHLGLGPARGARHLAAQAASLEPWRGFLNLLDTVRDFDEEAALAGAEAGFAAALAAFDLHDAEAECSAGV